MIRKRTRTRLNKRNHRYNFHRKTRRIRARLARRRRAWHSLEYWRTHVQSVCDTASL
ncbi:hypothetical protein [Moraxella caviae]|uniref:hypothetical protein n=1 Tax=Moraxella caviae TaxID=34060 RepID=UPI001300D778|nr:hypothetical protein [Moraxella caviae]